MEDESFEELLVELIETLEEFLEELELEAEDLVQDQLSMDLASPHDTIH